MKTTKSEVVWHKPTVTKARRAEKNRHKSAIIWFTGLSGAGKSTIAHAVEEHLYQLGCNTYVLDGDNVRHGLCKDLGFSDLDRTENIRRIAEMAKLFVDAGIITITAFISPFIHDRKAARDLVNDQDFLEIHCHCPLDVCESRDPKGLYQKARSGLIKDYTGISSPYEEPVNPELKIDTSVMSIDECVSKVISLLKERGVIA